ncbi:MAG: helix-turn-helix domain-containing protein [Bacteroidales bacterium]|nr:helix-turn-helix domain-containing protein [Candidatus Cacconaster equi]
MLSINLYIGAVCPQNRINKEIAEYLHVHPSTITREIQRNGYRWWDKAHGDERKLESTNAEPTRIPTDLFVSISPRVPTSQISRRSFWRKLSAN